MPFETLLPVLGDAAGKGLSGLFGGTKITNTNTASNAANVNPVILIGSGTGTGASGGASSSPSPYVSAPDYLPSDAVYGPPQPPLNQYGDISAAGPAPKAASISAGGMAGLFSNPLLLVVIGGAALFMFSEAKG